MTGAAAAEYPVVSATGMFIKNRDIYALHPNADLKCNSDQVKCGFEVQHLQAHNN